MNRGQELIEARGEVVGNPLTFMGGARSAPLFSRDDFKPLPYKAYCVFDAWDVLTAIRLHHVWGKFCLSGEEPNYFADTISQLLEIHFVVFEMMRKRNSCRMNPQVCYMEVGSRHIERWGNFVYLEGPEFERGSILGHPIILPQILFVDCSNGERIINETRY